MTTWLDVITSVSAGAVPLLGVWLGSHLQKGDKAQERRERENQLKREKAEEIFSEIDRVFDLNGEAELAALAERHGQSIEGRHTSIANFGRLRALLAIYFPELKDVVDKFDGEIAALAGPDWTPAEGVEPDESVKIVRQIKYEWVKSVNLVIFAGLQNIRTEMTRTSRALL